MSWDALSAEVAVMFGELDGSDEYQLTLESYARRMLIARTEQVKQAREMWVMRNPERARQSQRERTRRWKAKQRLVVRLARIGSKGGAMKAKNRMDAARAEIRRRIEEKQQRQQAA